MAKIISSRKKYVPVKDLKVYPSNKETIEVIPDDGFNGAHRYRAQMCAGFVNGKTKYVDPTYDCLECMGAVNDLHPANLFSFPIPEDMTYEDEPIKFEICLK